MTQKKNVFFLSRLENLTWITDFQLFGKSFATRRINESRKSAARHQGKEKHRLKTSAKVLVMNRCIVSWRALLLFFLRDFFKIKLVGVHTRRSVVARLAMSPSWRLQTAAGCNRSKENSFSYVVECTVWQLSVGAVLRETMDHFTEWDCYKFHVHCDFLIRASHGLKKQEVNNLDV